MLKKYFEPGSPFPFQIIEITFSPVQFSQSALPHSLLHLLLQSLITVVMPVRSA
jgi:hypothetical protein